MNTETITKGEHSGGNVSYYNLFVSNPKTGSPYYVECEDVIATFGMSFAEGTLLKSLWRSCAARTLGLQKRGGDAVYDAEKIVYYTQEILRNCAWQYIPSTILGDAPMYDTNATTCALEIAHPKRNWPCVAYASDITLALGMTFDESMCFLMLWSIMWSRRKFYKQDLADYVNYYASALLIRAGEVLQCRKQLASMRESVAHQHDTIRPAQDTLEGHADEDNFLLSLSNEGGLKVSALNIVGVPTPAPKQLDSIVEQKFIQKESKDT